MKTEPYENQDGRRCCLSRDEIDLFLSKAGDMGMREEIALSLGARCGLRVSEIVGVAPRNIDEHDVVGDRLEVEAEIAKCDRAREVPLPSELKYAILAHTEGNATDTPVIDVTTRTVERWVTRAAERCQAETGTHRWKYLGPHDLRRT